MTRPRTSRRPQRTVAPPLDPQRLTDLAYGYAARYAVTEGRLARYLATKVRERGWAGEGLVAEKISDLTARLVELGVINDAVVARSTVDLARRKGLAEQRLRAALASKQVRGDVAAAALAAQENDADGALGDACRFAQRKRLGPWRTVSRSPERLRRELAAMIRAGHGFSVARQVVEAADPADIAGAD